MKIDIAQLRKDLGAGPARQRTSPLAGAKVGDIYVVNHNAYTTTPSSVEFYEVVSSSEARRMTTDVHHNAAGGIVSVGPQMPYTAAAVPLSKVRKPKFGAVIKWNRRPYSVTDPRSI